MPKRTDIHSILIIGAGPIIIGQACEFDYSGAQACKALKEEGYRVILVNSNPATIMTDPNLADATYVEPITVEMVEKIIAKEKPDAILPTMGGQTGLNCALALHDAGILDKYGVQLIGATPDAIDKAENRKRFNEAMEAIGLEVPKNAVVESLEAAKEFLKVCGLPAIIRPSFTLGGTGGGVAYSEDEFERIVLSGLDASPTNQVLIDESLLGWKEYEMEVVRDKNDNCIIICSIENVDPMGVHTGDSITVAPALTLTDKEYQIMRDASCAVLREIGVETGGSNVQFGVNPKNGRMVVIEMNPRVSRSSALASKATGFPIAKIAAKLAVGYTLDELANDVVSGRANSPLAGESENATAFSGGGANSRGVNPPPESKIQTPPQGGSYSTPFMPASFEPTIDYVVTKIPRFTFEKFAGAKPILTSAMKSVGEVMAIGGTFQESLQKALRSLETGLTGLDEQPDKNLAVELSKLTPKRILQIAQAFREGWSLEKVHQTTAWDNWFLEQIQGLVIAEQEVASGKRDLKNPIHLLELKQMGFSDSRLSQLISSLPESQRDSRAISSSQAKDSPEIGSAGSRNDGVSEHDIREARHKLGIRPVYKRVDTCAAEFEALTPYMYSTYWGTRFDDLAEFQPGIEPCEAKPSEREKVMILGGGPNRIGQGIEFDYTCVHAALALRGQKAKNTGQNNKEAQQEGARSPEPAKRSLIENDSSHLQEQSNSYETIMVNCNPETVSTDYDTSDRLYFEPLTLEDVLEIVHVEQQNGRLHGLNIQFGGQTPLKLARGLQEHEVPLLGTSPDAIDLAEDREQFQGLLQKLNLKQPDNAIARNADETLTKAAEIGYPIVVRPSFVLGGRAMAIVRNEDGLERYLVEFPECFDGGPLLLDRFLDNAIEVDVDALSDGTDVFISGIMEHIEAAGVHSGDSACTIPPYSLPKAAIEEIKVQARSLALSLNVRGLMNVQFAVKQSEAITPPLRGSRGGESRLGEGYSEFAKSKAQSMRKALTKQEFSLWNLLKDKQLEGIKFRRQQPIGDYIVDFYSAEYRLVIEVDGSQHAGNNHDTKRDDWLKKQGLTILRFWNNEIYNNLEEVIETILRTISPPPASIDADSPARGKLEGFDIYILEVNPRASRTVPFVAKATGVPVAKIAARIMAGEGLVEVLHSLNSPLAGESILELEARNDNLPYMAVKEVVFPFSRFADVDVVLGPEMKSTGEVMGIDSEFAAAFAKAQLGTGFNFPQEGTVFISVKDEDKTAMVPIAKSLQALGFSIISTHGTAAFLSEQGIKVERINKVLEGSPHIVDRIKEGGVQLVINTTEGRKSIKDSFSIRRTALIEKIPYTTTATGAASIVKAMEFLSKGNGLERLSVKSLQDFEQVA